MFYKRALGTLLQIGLQTSVRGLFSAAKINLNYYRLLNLPIDSTKEEIKQAYYALAKKAHPDVNTDPAAGEYFRLLNEAYATLSDTKKRRQYDEAILKYTKGRRNNKADSFFFNQKGEYVGSLFSVNPYDSYRPSKWKENTGQKTNTEMVGSIRNQFEKQVKIFLIIGCMIMLIVTIRSFQTSGERKASYRKDQMRQQMEKIGMMQIYEKAKEERQEAEAMRKQSVQENERHILSK